MQLFPLFSSCGNLRIIPAYILNNDFSNSILSISEGEKLLPEELFINNYRGKIASPEPTDGREEERCGGGSNSRRLLCVCHQAAQEYRPTGCCCSCVVFDSS